MRAVIAVPFFDTEENGRAGITRDTLCDLYYDLDSRHVIVPVDNGSTDLSTWEWIQTIRPFHSALRLEEPRPVACAVNTAWHQFHDELVRGDAIAVKFDSDIEVQSHHEDWIEHIIDILLRVPEIGLIGPRLIGKPPHIERPYYGIVETEFVYGATVARSPTCFRAIGYCRNPGDVRWGWDDHWDCFRAKMAGLKLVVDPYIETGLRCTQSALPGGIRDAERARGREALVRWMAEVHAGRRGIYEEFMEET